jgi:hypothetical protein
MLRQLRPRTRSVKAVRNCQNSEIAKHRRNCSGTNQSVQLTGFQSSIFGNCQFWQLPYMAPEATCCVSVKRRYL